jgi:hypothetical protein
MMMTYSASALAVDANVGETTISLNGFGTLGLLHSDYDQADFVTSDLFHPSGVGFTRAWGTDQDTDLGLQLTATFAKRLTAVVQVVSSLRYNNTFRPQVEWANLKYDFTPDVSVRVGRVLLPTFLSSATERVGYVNPWVRTPAEVLVQLPVTNSDGADVSYHANIGGVSNLLQVLYGSNKSDLPGDQVYENTGIKALTDTIEYGPATLHVSYQKMRYSVDLASVTHPQTFAFSCVELGLMIDPGRWYASAELFNTQDEGLGHTQAWYLGGGYRIGRVTPYAAVSKIEQTSIGSSGLAPIFDQQTLMVGLRWDFMKNFDAKLQFEQVESGSLSVATSFVNIQPAARLGDKAHVLSATIDFVW